MKSEVSITVDGITLKVSCELQLEALVSDDLDPLLKDVESHTVCEYSEKLARRIPLVMNQLLERGVSGIRTEALATFLDSRRS